MQSALDCMKRNNFVNETGIPANGKTVKLRFSALSVVIAGSLGRIREVLILPVFICKYREKEPADKPDCRFLFPDG